MLCYLVVAEVGYMVGGAWLADREGWGMTGALYHILADALMTLCLFIAAAIFAKRAGATRLEHLEGAFGKMPITMVGFMVGVLAMIGVPPTCGFFSKFYLIRGALDAGHFQYVAALLISSLVNAVLFFRILEIALFGNKPAEGHDHHGGHHGPIGRCEGKLTSLLPLLITAALIVLLGLFNGPVVEIIRSSLPEVVTSTPITQS